MLHVLPCWRIWTPYGLCRGPGANCHPFWALCAHHPDVSYHRSTLMSHCGKYLGIPDPVFRSAYHVPPCECLLSPWACHSTPRVCIHHQCMETPSQHVSMYYIHTYVGLGQTFQHRWVRIQRRDTLRFRHPAPWRLVNVSCWQTRTWLPHLICK